MSTPKGYENLVIETKDGEVRMRGTIEDPELVKRLRLIAAQRKISYEKALELIMEKGASVILKSTPVDGSTQHAG